MISPKHVYHVLIDNGTSLNIFSTSLLTQLGYGDDCIDAHKKITIKAYDEEEQRSKGLVVLPIRFGPVEWDVIFQVLDIPLAYNILLGWTCIHKMQEIPSMYKILVPQIRSHRTCQYKLWLQHAHQNCW